MRLTATTALHKFGSFADDLTDVDAVVLDEAVAGSTREQRLAIVDRANTYEGVLDLGAQLESDILDSLGRKQCLAGDDADAIALHGLLQQFLLVGLSLLVNELLSLLFHVGILAYEAFDSAAQVGSAIEELAQRLHGVLQLIESFFDLGARDGFDTTNTCSDAALAYNLEHSNLSGSLDVTAAAELYALTELYDADAVAILLAEEGDGTELLGFLDGHIAMVLQRNILADAGVDDALHLTQFLGCDLLEVAEVEAQAFGRDERAFLLYVCAEHFAQGLVEEVRGAMVGFAGAALVGVDTCHELCLGMLGQALGDVHGEAVLALSVDNIYCLKLADEDALVAHLSAHLCVEGGVVEHELIIGLLLLHYLAVAEDMAIVFGEVPADEFS